ncbi:hypothetical protein HY638_01055 [Candidatus Woesearchaeota archaeon]|nr:hypothetical protein [Candidatus Woesearchaeota archaeon]
MKKPDWKLWIKDRNMFGKTIRECTRDITDIVTGFRLVEVPYRFNKSGGNFEDLGFASERFTRAFILPIGEYKIK